MERPFLTAGDIGSEMNISAATAARPDPAAGELKKQVQEVVLQDRDLSEKVGLPLWWDERSR